jgi:hypothetical protein
MFRPKCMAIFRLIFEQVKCTIDIAFNLRDLVLQELFSCFFNTYFIKIPHLNFNLKFFI